VKSKKKGLRQLCTYQISDWDHTVCVDRRGHYFIKACQEDELRPVTKTEAICDWLRGAAPDEWEKYLISIVNKASKGVL